MRYDYVELKKFLLPDHKWIYFSIRVLRSNGWVYFSISMLPVFGTFLVSDQPITGRSLIGHFLLSLGAGLVSLKAYRSQSPNGDKEEPVQTQNDLPQ